jgi:hypothetical protein
MKVSLSHLQFENEQLKTEVVKLKNENRSLDERLVQEQIHNGDLTARLDDARNMLRDRGVDSDTRLGSRTRGTRGGDVDEEIASPRTRPAGQTTRKPRKPPAASIRGDLDDLPKASETDEAPAGTISFRANNARPRRKVFPDDPPLSVEDDQLHWQPVASGPAPSAPARR